MKKSNSPSLSQAEELFKNKKYQECIDLIDSAPVEGRDDSYHRLKSQCLEGLKKYIEAIPSLEAIARPKADDLKQLGISYFLKKEYSSALKAIDKSLRLDETAHSRFIRGLILTGGLERSSYYKLSENELATIAKDYERAHALNEPFPNLYLEWAEIAGAKGDYETQKSKKLEILELGLNTCAGTSPSLREKIAEICIYREPKKAFDVLKPTLDVQTESHSSRFILASQAAIRSEEFGHALRLLEVLPKEYKTLPGYFPILADVLNRLGQKEEAWDQWDQAIISDEPSAQVYGFLGRARACLQSNDFARAKLAMENATQVAIDSDILTEPHEFPYFQREFYYYEGKHYYDFVKDALSINDALKIWGADLYWKLKFWNLMIDVGAYIDWSNVHEDDAKEMNPDEVKRRNESAQEARDSLFEIAKHFAHPHLSKHLSQAYVAQEEWENALVHGISSSRWQYSTLKNKYRVPACHFPDEIDIDREAALKIHSICMKALSECQDPVEADQVFSSTYACAWGPVLKSNDLANEIRKATSMLVAKNPDCQHWDTWWDYAYYSDKSDANSDQRQEYGYRKLLEHDPKNASAAHNLALVLRRINKLTEAWEFSQRAYSIAPKDKIIAGLYEQLAPRFQYQEVLREQMKTALNSPVMFESLSPRSRLYLSAFLRSCLTEDGKQILPANRALRKIAPTSEHTDAILSHLYEENVLVINPTSPSDAVTCKTLKNGRIKISLADPHRIEWVLNIRSEARPNVLPTSFLTELLDPTPLLPDEQDSIGVELWREIGVEECLEHLQQYRGEVNLEAEIGDKTREVFSDLMLRYSTGQIVGLIKKKVPECLAAYESRKVASRKHAANLVPGSCQSYAEFLTAKSWTPPLNSRHPECEQSLISKILFDRLLEIGSDGYAQIPGMLGVATISSSLSSNSTLNRQTSQSTPMQG